MVQYNIDWSVEIKQTLLVYRQLVNPNRIRPLRYEDQQQLRTADKLEIHNQLDQYYIIGDMEKSKKNARHDKFMTLLYWHTDFSLYCNDRNSAFMLSVILKDSQLIS